MTTTPRERIAQVEATPSLPAGSEERFSGYGVMGLPFRSGHVLAMRRFTTTSVGPGYTSIWHRTPSGEWVFYADAAPRLTCTRYFGAMATDAVPAEIGLEWTGPFGLRITMPALRFEWDVVVRATRATRFMNAAGRLLPAGAWHRPQVLSAMGAMARPLLGVGRVGLHGRVPNGQHFIANPRTMWAISGSRARMGDEDFGAPGAVHPQAHLGDFWIPQRGMLAIGEAYFDPFDAARHSPTTSRAT